MLWIYKCSHTQVRDGNSLGTGGQTGKTRIELKSICATRISWMGAGGERTKMTLFHRLLGRWRQGNSSAQTKGDLDRGLGFARLSLSACLWHMTVSKMLWTFRRLLFYCLYSRFDRARVVSPMLGAFVYTVMSTHIPGISMSLLDSASHSQSVQVCSCLQRGPLSIASSDCSNLSQVYFLFFSETEQFSHMRTNRVTQHLRYWAPIWAPVTHSKMRTLESCIESCLQPKIAVS